jgi:hypothetical protein
VELALTSLNLVTTKVLLGFSVCCVLARDWVILLEADFFSRVLRVLGGVVCTVTSEFTDQTNQLTLRVLLCHESA